MPDLAVLVDPLPAPPAIVDGTGRPGEPAPIPHVEPPPAPPAIARPADGVVGEIDVARGIFFLKPREEGETPVGVAIALTGEAPLASVVLGLGVGACHPDQTGHGGDDYKTLA